MKQEQKNHMEEVKGQKRHAHAEDFWFISQSVNMEHPLHVGTDDHRPEAPLKMCPLQENYLLLLIIKAPAAFFYILYTCVVFAHIKKQLIIKGNDFTTCHELWRDKITLVCLSSSLYHTTFRCTFIALCVLVLQ